MAENALLAFQCGFRKKWRMTMKAFIASEFVYCSLVWMFHNRKLNSRVNKIHEKGIKNSLSRLHIFIY